MKQNSDPVTRSVVALLEEMPRTMMKLLNKSLMDSKRVNLNRTQILTIVSIFLNSGESTMTGMAEKVGVKKGAFTRVVDGLCERGYLRREQVDV